jgi:hypothetical protein
MDALRASGKSLPCGLRTEPAIFPQAADDALDYFRQHTPCQLQNLNIRWQIVYIFCDKPATMAVGQLRNFDLNNQHIAEPTLFYLKHLARKERVKGQTRWLDCEGNRL